MMKYQIPSTKMQNQTNVWAHLKIFLTAQKKIYMRPKVRLVQGKTTWPPFLKLFGHGYKYNCKKSSRNFMRTSDTAFESWDFIFFNEKIFDVLRGVYILRHTIFFSEGGVEVWDFVWRMMTVIMESKNQTFFEGGLGGAKLPQKIFANFEDFCVKFLIM